MAAYVYNPAYTPAWNQFMQMASARQSAKDAASGVKLPEPTAVAGAPPLSYSAQYGGIPQVPNPITVAGQTYGQNMAAYQTLSDQVANANQANLIAQYERGLPNYNALLNTSSANIAANIGGQLDKNVQDLIWQQAAERGVFSGLPGSQFATYGGLMNTRDIALQLQAQGQQQLNAAIARTPIGKGLEPSQWLVTPAQQYEAQLYANTLNAAPIPAAAGQAAWQAANYGLNRGLNTPYAQPNQLYGDKNQQTLQTILDILKRYMPTATPTPTPAAAPPLATSPGVAQGGYGSAYSGPASYDYGLPNYYEQPQYNNPGNYGGYDQATADYFNYFGEEY